MLMICDLSTKLCVMYVLVRHVSVTPSAIEAGQMRTATSGFQPAAHKFTTIGSYK